MKLKKVICWIILIMLTGEASTHNLYATPTKIKDASNDGWYNGYAKVNPRICLTAQDKFVGDAYWTQFGYGATNALLQELDVAAMVDGVLFFIGTQLKNQFECVKKGGFVYLVVTANTYEDAVLAASQCLLGVNMTVEEWKALYAKSKEYISKNWNEPYLHGQATVFVATILIPYTKLSKVTKLKLLTKLRGNTNFVNKIDELEKLSKLADEGDDVGKVMDDLAKGADNIPGLVGKVDNVVDDIVQAALREQDVLDELVRTNNAISDAGKKFWANHEINVTRYLRETLGNSKVGRQILPSQCLPSRGLWRQDKR